MNKSILEEIEAPLEMPVGPPQLESEANASLMVLMDQSPPWTEDMYPEAYILLKQHVSLRSLLGYALQVAKQEEHTLRFADEPKDLHRAQGGINALHKYYLGVMDPLLEMDNKKDDEDELEESHPQ